MATPSQESIQGDPGRIPRWVHAKAGTQGSHQDAPTRQGDRRCAGKASARLATEQSWTAELEAPGWGRGTELPVC